jgi:3-methyladenine DNA glycosylase AlkD
MPKTATERMTVEEVLAWLREHGSQEQIDGLARYGITTDRAVGVSVGTLQSLAKRLGKDHTLAEQLWETGCYEARMLASFIGEPARVTPEQMDAWVEDFDNWAVCDTVCFHLWDRTPHAWQKARQWATAEREFVKRTGFVLMACLVAHDDDAQDADFLPFLPLIEESARDERNFVKKGVNWALRNIGRCSPALNAAALEVAERLAASDEPSCRWVGKDARRELTSAKVQAKLAARN